MPIRLRYWMESARAEARRQFGNVGLKQEQSREIWMKRFWPEPGRNVRYGGRIMTANNAFSALAVLSLALGISGMFPYGAFETLREENPVFSTLFGYFNGRNRNMAVRRQTTSASTEYVIGEYFRGLAVSPAAAGILRGRSCGRAGSLSSVAHESARGRRRSGSYVSRRKLLLDRNDGPSASRRKHGPGAVSAGPLFPSMSCHHCEGRRFISTRARAAAAVCLVADTIEAFGLRWQVPIAADWKVENLEGAPVLELLVPRPATEPRRPTQFALAETPDYTRVTVEAEVKKEPAALRNRHTSLMIAYAWRDANHFNYAHLSVDSSEKQEVHNGVFHVDGGDRVRISPRLGPGSLLEEKWYPVRLVWDGASGAVTVWVDGKTSPSLHAVEPTFKAGRVGIGSFFDLGSFRKVKISGEK